ncbi:MAG: Xaa-Pro peptidase family protein [Planctomycetales bacterium]
MTDRSAPRRQKLRQALKGKGLGAELITNPTNVRYLTGFTGEDSYLLLTRDNTILISDGRFTTQIEQECPDLEVFIRPTSVGMKQAVAQILKKSRVTEVGFESHYLTVDAFEAFRSGCEGVEFVPLPPLVEELREIKDAEEIAAIREAIRQAEKGFGTLKANLLPQLTEREVAFDLEHAMRRFGAKGASFETIVAVGARAALPHARPTETRIADDEFVLVDWGADGPTGYKSDLTRVLVTGKRTSKFEKVYEIVRSAQVKAIEAIRPGISGREVDQVARSVIEEAGYGKYFTHSLGHGIGLDIHEGPRLSPAANTELKVGMVVTAEPGIYIPKWGGVRIEDDVLVTKDGYEVLTSVPKDLESCFLE